MKIILASHNEHKLKELNSILKSSKIRFQSLNDIGWSDEIEENGQTIEENAWIKAEAVWRVLSKPVLAEDTGLIIDALNGAPGVHSARYAGLDKNADKNVRKVLAELGNSDNRSARFKTVIALIIDKNRHQFTGICEGKIGYIRTGSGGFGYDPIFIPEGYKRSFGQLPDSTKDKISHRAQAVQAMMKFFKNSLLK